MLQKPSKPIARHEKLPDPALAIIEEANRKTMEAAKQPLQNPGVTVDPRQDPRYLAACTDYAIWVLDHDRKSYEWHHTSSVIIFYVVILLVMSGIWFSWMQFRIAHHHPVAAQTTTSTAIAPATPANSAVLTVGGDQSQPAAVVTEQKDSVTEFSASAQGVKVASSAIGVVILVISMCFFYLYLEKVYPITVTPPPHVAPAQTSGN